MISIEDLLASPQLKGTLNKFGIPEKHAGEAVKQGVSFISEKFQKNPKLLSSLISSQANSREDEQKLKELSKEYALRICKKFSLPSSVADQASDALPGIIQFLGGKLSALGLNNQQGIGTVLKLLQSSGKGGVMGMVQSAFGFFGKK